MSGFLGVFHLHPCSMGQSIQRMLPFLGLNHEDRGEAKTFIEQGVEIGSLGFDLYYSRKKNTLLSYSGNIDNLEKLSQDIKNEGFTFQKLQPGEILLLAFKVWGKEFVKRLEGQFNILIYDRKRHTLYLFRDHLGEKPLYWYKNSKDFVFSTQLKSLLASGLVPQTPSMKGIGAFLQLGFIPQNLSLIKNVHSLLPGHYLEYRMDQYLSVTPYHSLATSNNEKDKTPLLIDSLRKQESRSAHFFSLNLKKGEDKCIELSPEPMSLISLPNFRMKDVFDNLSLFVWICEQPLNDVHLPLFLHSQSIYCKKNEISQPMSALGQQSVYLPTDIMGEDFPYSTRRPKFAVKVSQFLKALFYIRATPAGLEFPWIDDFIDELGCPPNIKKISKEPFQSFSPNLYLKNYAHTIPAKSIRSFIFHFYNFAKLPSWELMLKNSFSEFHQVNWKTPFIHSAFYKDLPSVQNDQSPLSFSEINQADLSENEIKMVLESLSVLKNGKLAELGLFNTTQFDKLFRITKRGFGSMHHLWPFLTLEIWLQLFVDTSPKTTPPPMNLKDILKH